MMTFDELRSKYPRLLRPEQHFEHDVGWTGILDDYFSVVDRELPVDAVYSIQQIKEKMGSLTIYDVHPPSEAITDARKLASARSYYTCERCGQPGVMRDLHHWRSVRCEEHASETGEYAPQKQPATFVRIGSGNPQTWRQYDPELDVFVDIDPPEWSRPR